MVHGWHYLRTSSLTELKRLEWSVDGIIYELVHLPNLKTWMVRGWHYLRTSSLTELERLEWSMDGIIYELVHLPNLKDLNGPWMALFTNGFTYWTWKTWTVRGWHYLRTSSLTELERLERSVDGIIYELVHLPNLKDLNGPWMALFTN